jgi:hypothetical protein
MSGKPCDQLGGSEGFFFYNGFNYWRTTFFAEITFRRNITSIYRKLGVDGRAAALKKAVEIKTDVIS